MRVKNVPLEEIKERKDSQRKSPRGIEELMDSIKRIGLIHPIVLDDDDTLIVGGNRLEAYRRLGKDKIPVTYRKDLDEADSKIIELEENVRRADLTWQELSRAVRDLRAAVCLAHPEWSVEKITSYLGYKKSYVHELCQVADELDKKNINVINASNLTAARNTLSRESKRRIDDEANEMHAMIMGQQEGIEEDDDEDCDAQLPTGTSQPAKQRRKRDEVIHGDFGDWAGGV